MMLLPLQPTPNSTVVVLLLFISLLVSVVLSVVIVFKGVQGYRTSHDQGIVLLVGGILLLSGIPTSINVVLATATAVPGWGVATTVDLIRLLGLLIILVSIYDR